MFEVGAGLFAQEVVFRTSFLNTATATVVWPTIVIVVVGWCAHINSQNQDCCGHRTDSSHSGVEEYRLEKQSQPKPKVIHANIILRSR